MLSALFALMLQRAANPALSPQRRAPRPPQFAVDLLDSGLCRLKWAVKGLDRRRRRAFARP
jgi:hypothetical protein